MKTADEHDLRLLLKRSEVCKALSISGQTLSKMVAEGHLPPPVRLGSTPHSDRWNLATLEQVVDNLPQGDKR